MRTAFGITGGICAGKSRVTKLFIANDIPVVDADTISRQAVIVGSEGYQRLFATFGAEYFADGYLDRKKLADLIFFNDGARRALNSIMIPIIRQMAQKQIANFHKAGNRVVGFDSALIVEMGEADMYRPLIVVHCPPETQIARMMRRRLLTRREAVARLKAQLPREDKIKIADFVIDSSGPKPETESQAKEILHKIKNLIK